MFLILIEIIIIYFYLKEYDSDLTDMTLRFENAPKAKAIE